MPSAPPGAVADGRRGHYDVTMKRSRRTMTAATFKARCLALLDEVAASGERIVITKRGRPVAELGPLGGSPRKSLRGSVLFYGDIISPIDEPWEADR